MIKRYAVLLPSLFALLLSARDAHGHKLEVACHVQLGWKVRVEGWYEDGEPAPGARVKVMRSDGSVLTEGKLDRHGVFIFSFTSADTLRVSVSSAGHRAEVTIPGETLARHIACTSAVCLMPSPLLSASILAPISADDATSAAPLNKHASAFPIWGVLGGVALLLGVAAFFNWRLKQKTNHSSI
jgi:hypothetical protein